MRLQAQIKKDLTIAMKEKKEGKKEVLRVILGELGRSEKKELPDDDVIKVLKKLIKSEKELLERKQDDSNSEFINIIENYLPKMVTNDEIKTWIAHHVDFSEFKTKMQAMGLIMKHFGPAADGNSVKKILQEM